MAVSYTHLDVYKRQAQNSARICRALLLVGINRRWGTFMKIMLSICKSIDKRIWAFEHPLSQFDLPETVLRNIRAKNPSMETLRDMESAELGDLVHNNRMGNVLYKLVGRFPYVDIFSEIFPITSNVMRVHVSLEPDFVWDERYHGNAQIFWLTVEESDQFEILHVEKFILNKKQMRSPHEMDFMIPLTDPLPPQIIVRLVSDSWIGSESVHAISFQHLIRPSNETLRTNPVSYTHLDVYKRQTLDPGNCLKACQMANSATTVLPEPVGEPTNTLELSLYKEWKVIVCIGLK